MIAAHLPHIPRIPEWDVRRGLPIRGFFTMHDIFTALIGNVSILTGIFTCSAIIKNGAESLCTVLFGTVRFRSYSFAPAPPSMANVETITIVSSTLLGFETMMPYSPAGRSSKVRR